MTLNQYHALKLWHTRHSREHPLEKNVWELILTLALAGWVGIPAFLLVQEPLAVVACMAATLLPSRYVAWRTRLHQRGTLRCDWVIALR
jgi:hypothetical protein